MCTLAQLAARHDSRRDCGDVAAGRASEALPLAAKLFDLAEAAKQVVPAVLVKTARVWVQLSPSRARTPARYQAFW